MATIEASGEKGEHAAVDAALEQIKRGERDLEQAIELEERARKEIAEGTAELERAERQHDKPRTFSFFVSGQQYETDQPSLTGLQIKAKVPDWDPTHDLVLEGEGDAPDRVIRDDESVSLHSDHGPLRFSSVPKANFG